MFLEKKWKRMGRKIVLTTLMGVLLLLPISGLAASEAMPEDPNLAQTAEVISSSAPTVETEAVAPVETPVQNVPAEAVSAPVQATPVEAPAETTPVETSAETAPVETPAQNVPAETPAQTMQGETAQSEAAASDVNAEGQQEISIFPMLVVLIGLVIVVAVIVAVSTAVSSVAVAVDDEEE